MRSRLIHVYIALLAACCSVGAAAAQEGDESLAAQARDPTASLTAFQIRYDYTSSFHGVSDADLGAVVLQPIIPFKLGEQRHIARITMPIVTHAPNLSGLGDIAQNPLPPNFIPTQDASGLGDTALLDVLIFDASWGRWGVGPVLPVPTASDKALGSGQVVAGPCRCRHRQGRRVAGRCPRRHSMTGRPINGRCPSISPSPRCSESANSPFAWLSVGASMPRVPAAGPIGV